MRSGDKEYEVMKCKYLNDYDSTCMKIGRVCPGVCKDHEPVRKFKAFGWEVIVEFFDYHQETFHWRGCTENGARRKGMLKTCASKIIKVIPVTEEQWLRSYGLGRM